MSPGGQGAAGIARQRDILHLAVDQVDERGEELIHAETLERLFSGHAEHVTELGQGTFLTRQVTFGLHSIKQRPEPRICAAEHPDGHWELIKPSVCCAAAATGIQMLPKARRLQHGLRASRGKWTPENQERRTKKTAEP
jgi:hypothetical protein